MFCETFVVCNGSRDFWRWFHPTPFNRGHFWVLRPLYQNKVKCSAFDMEMVLIFILVQVKLISTRKIVHLASFWKWGFLELRMAYLFQSENKALYIAVWKIVSLALISCYRIMFCSLANLVMVSSIAKVSSSIYYRYSWSILSEPWSFISKSVSRKMTFFVSLRVVLSAGF